MTLETNSCSSCSPASLPLHCIPTWLPLAGTCTSLPFLASEVYIALLYDRLEVLGNECQLPAVIIGLILHQVLAAFAVLFRFCVSLYGVSSEQFSNQPCALCLCVQVGLWRSPIIFSEKHLEHEILTGLRTTMFQIH